MMAAAAVFGAMSARRVMDEAPRFEVAILRAPGSPDALVFAAMLREVILPGCIARMLGALVVYVSINGFAANALGGDSVYPAIRAARMLIATALCDG